MQLIVMLIIALLFEPPIVVGAGSAAAVPSRAWLLKKPAWLDHQPAVALIFAVKTAVASLANGRSRWLSTGCGIFLRRIASHSARNRLTTCG